MTKRTILLIGGATPDVREALEQNFTVHDAGAIGDMDGFLATHGAEIEAVATNGADGAPERIARHLPNLKIVASNGVGYDGIDARGLAEKGVIVTHTPDVLNDEVANTTIALMLAVGRRVVALDKLVRAGGWKGFSEIPLTRGLAGKTVGILGFGRIGKTIAHKLSVFGVTVVYHSRTAKPDAPYRYYGDLVEMARDVDYLVVITPGGAGTAKLVNRAVLDALGPDGTLINVARGSVVDEAALVAALKEGRLGAAGLDVFEKEPHVPEELLGMENVVLLPHVGSATVETRGAMGKLMVDNLVQWFSTGKAITPVPECRHLNG